MNYTIFNPSWPKIEGFPRYCINQEGEVWDTEREIQIHPNVVTGGALAVNLKDEFGQYRTRSVKMLVARTFVDFDFDTEHFDLSTFDTPILLDNNYHNVSASNIRWRPRWFAWKYSHQFIEPKSEYYRGPMKCFQNNLTFENVMAVGMHYGVLFEKVYASAHAFETGDYSEFWFSWDSKGEMPFPIWPINKSFAFIN